MCKMNVELNVYFSCKNTSFFQIDKKLRPFFLRVEW